MSFLWIQRLSYALVAIAAGAIFLQQACAQRVQFPSAANAPPALSSFDPYGNPLLGTPPPDVPYAVQPQFNQPTAPSANPFGAPAAPGVPQQGGSVFPSGLPFQWESGAYHYQNTNGSSSRLQRFLQQISYEQTWIQGDLSEDELEINRTEISATFGIPVFYNPDTPLLITPGFAFNWLGGPVGEGGASGTADLPPRLFDAYLDAAWHPRLSDWLHADLGVRTGVWSDFEEVNSDSVRILGRGLGVLALSPKFDVLVGAWYLDRNRIKLLPAGGVHWRPNSEWDAYVVFPNPKIRKRFFNIGSSQWWWYVAGEYGGGRWTVERAGGIADNIDINEIRTIFGLEWETQTQARGHIEVGYVWDREILFDRTKSPPKIKLDDTVMVRAGINF